MDTLTGEWDEALERVQVYLGTLKIGGAEHRARMALRLLERAKSLAAEKPGQEPIVLVMDLVNEDLEKWFGEVLPGVPPAKRVPMGLVALRMTGAAERWPDVVMDHEAPDEMKAQLAGVTVRSGPDLAVSSMISRPMDYGPMETLAQETWHHFAWAPLARAALLWTGIFFLGLFLIERVFPQ